MTGNTRHILSRIRRKKSPQTAATKNLYSTWVYVLAGTTEDIVNLRMQQVRDAEKKSVQPSDETRDLYAANKTAKDVKIDKMRRLLGDNIDEDGQAVLDNIGHAYDRKGDKILSPDLLAPGINEFYLNPEMQKQMNESAKGGDTSVKFRVESLQGVGTKYANPARMNPETGKISYSPFARVRGYLSGAGEKQNNDYVLKQLKRAKKDGVLPSRIILNGHSRGAAATIALARAIYLEFGNDIKIAMNISDPVPGPGRRSESKKVIPPNVDSLVITYAERRMPNALLDKTFNPLDVNDLLFDPSKTTVTTTTLPIAHTLDGETLSDRIAAENAMGAINTGMVTAISAPADSPKYKLSEVEALRSDTKHVGEGIRKGRNFFIATDPQQNRALPPALKALHIQLQEKAYIEETDINTLREDNRSLVSRATLHIDERSENGRKIMLSAISRAGKEAQQIDKIVGLNEHLHKNNKNYRKWSDEVGATLTTVPVTAFKTYQDNIINLLNKQINALQEMDPDNSNKATQMKISALQYAEKVITQLEKPASADDAAKYYVTLKNLVTNMEMHRKKSFLSKTIDLLRPLSRKDEITQLIDSSINNMLYPTANKGMIYSNNEHKEQEISPRRHTV